MSKAKVLSQIEERLDFVKSELARIEKLPDNPARTNAIKMRRKDIEFLEMKYARIKSKPKPLTRREWLETVIAKIDERPFNTQTRWYKNLRVNFVNQLDDLRG